MLKLFPSANEYSYYDNECAWQLSNWTVDKPVKVVSLKSPLLKWTQSFRVWVSRTYACLLDGLNIPSQSDRPGHWQVCDCYCYHSATKVLRNLLQSVACYGRLCNNVMSLHYRLVFMFCLVFTVFALRRCFVVIVLQYIVDLHIARTHAHTVSTYDYNASRSVSDIFGIVL